MEWYQKPGIFTYDLLPQVDQVVGNYLFQSPPALRELRICVKGDIEVRIDGAKVEAFQKTISNQDCIEAQYYVDDPKKEDSLVEISILHEKGIYGGAAFMEHIKMTCGKGLLALGDWSLQEGLYNYSGGAYYRKTITLDKGQLQNKIILSLGEVVSSVEVSVNGKKVGIKVAPAWDFDISGFTVEGENEIEVLVYNTLSNHYTSIPTRYRGSLKSGLLGTVTIRNKKEKELGVR